MTQQPGRRETAVSKGNEKAVHSGQQDLTFNKQFIVFKQVSLIGMDHAVMKAQKRQENRRPERWQTTA